MSVTRICDFCSRGNPEVWRYTLTRKERDEAGVKHSTSNGGIDMCRPDWERICKPRMKAESLDWHMAGDPVCDRCGGHDGVRRFSVKKSVRDGDVVRDIAGGGLSLCHDCWTSVARPRMRAFHLKQEHRAQVERTQRTTGGIIRALRPRQSQG
jgi:hypothetical protein